MALTKASMMGELPDPKRSAGMPDAMTQTHLAKLQIPKQATAVGPRRGRK